VASTPEIPADERLYRRIAPHQRNPDGTVNSSAFKRNKEYEWQISVDRSSLTTPQESVDRAGRAGFHLASLLTSEVLDLEFSVEWNPLPENKAHTLIQGQNDRVRSRKLAAACQIVPGIESRDIG